MLFVCFFNLSNAQDNNAFYITWDNAVECQLSDFPDRKDYLELIEDGNCLRVCQYARVKYTIHNVNANFVNVTWNIVGGTIIQSTLTPTSCEVLWSHNLTAGILGATVTTTSGVEVLPNLCVELIKRPRAKFAKSPNTIDVDNEEMHACLNETFFFKNLSTDNGGTNIIDYNWEFIAPNGTVVTSSAFEPSYTFDQEGKYKVNLKVTNACNCQNTSFKTVIVGKKSVSIVCPSVVCEGQKANYSIVTDQRCSDYLWSIIGGTIKSNNGIISNNGSSAAPDPYYSSTIDVVWNNLQELDSNDGFGYITFNPILCDVNCVVPTTIKVPVILNKGTIKGDKIICGKAQQRYTLPKWPSTDFVWEVINDANTNATFYLTDQRNEVIVTSAGGAGTIALRCTYQNTLLKCGGTAEISIILKDEVNIEGVIETCIGTTETYGTSSGELGFWTLEKLPITLGSVPILTGETISIPFNIAGNYRLSVTGVNFCKSTSTIITVKSSTPVLDADIMGSRIVCPSSPSIFTVNNTVVGTRIVWEVPANVGTIIGSKFGNEVQVVFNYPIPSGAAYQIKAWRENFSEPLCPSTKTTISLFPEVLDLTITGPLQPCGSTIASYTIPATTIGEVYNWSIDPPTSGSIIANGEQTVEILLNEFALSQAASVKIAVTKCNIPSTSAPLQVNISSPTISITVPTSPICRGNDATFSVTGIPLLNNGTGTITWDFGDGTTTSGSYATTSIVSHSYTAINTSNTSYPVTVTVVNPNGCSSTITKSTTVNVLVAPVANISPSGNYSFCSPQDVNLLVTATAQNGYGNTTEVVWYKNNIAITPFGALTYSYTITTPGTYYALVSNGVCSTTTNRVQVTATPCETTCTDVLGANLTLAVNNNCGAVAATATYTGTPQTVVWIPLGLQTSTNTTATYSFIQAGVYNIGYNATYNVNGQLCKASKLEAKTVPYIADISYTISCGTAGNYTVKLTDSSNYYPLTPITNWVFLKNGTTIPQAGTDLQSNRTISLAPGTYTFTLTVSGSGYPACTKQVTVVLPAMPTATFTYDNNVCFGKATHFTTPTQPNVTYKWNFGDGTFNLLQNPDREYAAADLYNAKLTVTNQYGCSTTSSLQPVTILPNNQDGEIEPPAIACQGSTTNLVYNPDSSLMPSTSYQWLYNNLPIAGATTNPYAVSLPGSYSIVVGAANGCNKRINESVAVAFIKPPAIAIYGLQSFCSNQAVVLSVNAIPGALYQWTRSDTGTAILSSFSNLEDNNPTTGTYTYTVQIKIPSGQGNFYCTTTLNHTVTIVEEPMITDLTFNITCNPYTVDLHAQANSNGVFNWSDGKTGADIIENQGGVYRVTFTNTAGCSVTSDITVPKNPDNYMWIFPDGCYNFCNGFVKSSTLIGPKIAAFPSWSWQENDLSVQDDVDIAVADFSLARVNLLTNTYNLVLNNGYCALKSKNMTLDAFNCTCDINASLKGAIQFITQPFNQYVMTITIQNTGPAQVVTLTAPNNVGVFIPATVTVPHGGANFNFVLVTDTGFDGGTVVLKLTGLNRNDELCIGNLTVDLVQSNANRMQQANAIETGLKVTPNPVKNVVQLDFDYGVTIGNDIASILVYDLLGRVLAQHTPKTTKDVWLLDMSGYQAGQYVVVMRLNDTILQQKNIAVVH